MKIKTTISLLAVCFVALQAAPSFSQDTHSHGNGDEHSHGGGAHSHEVVPDTEVFFGDDAEQPQGHGAMMHEEHAHNDMHAQNGGHAHDQGHSHGQSGDHSGHANAGEGNDHRHEHD